MINKNKINIILTIDGDWKEYSKNIEPSKNRMLEYINIEIELIKKYCEGKFIHFIHTSPLAENHFLEDEYIELYKKIKKNGGDIGIHPHYENLNTDIAQKKMDIFLKEGTKKLDIKACRFGYFQNREDLYEILLNYNIKYDFSPFPYRIYKGKEKIFSDWSEFDPKLMGKVYKKKGLYQIAVGSIDQKKSLYIENSNLREFINIINELYKKTVFDYEKTFFACVTHSYCFPPLRLNDNFPIGYNALYAQGRYLYYFSRILYRLFARKNLHLQTPSYSSMKIRRHFIEIIKLLKHNFNLISFEELRQLHQRRI